MIAIASDDEKPPERQKYVIPKLTVTRRLPSPIHLEYIEEIAPFDEAEFERIKAALLKLGRILPGEIGELKP